MSRLMLSMASWFTLVMLLTCPPALSIWTMTATRFTSLRAIWSASELCDRHRIRLWMRWAESGQV
jgi:hypothetical protein